MRNDNKTFTWPTLAMRQKQMAALVKRRDEELDAGSIAKLNEQIAAQQEVIDAHPESLP